MKVKPYQTEVSMRKLLPYLLFLILTAPLGWTGTGGSGSNVVINTKQTFQNPNAVDGIDTNYLKNVDLYLTFQVNSTASMTNPNWVTTFQGYVPYQDFSIRNSKGDYSALTYSYVPDTNTFTLNAGSQSASSGGSLYLTNATDDIVKVDKSANGGNCYSGKYTNLGCNTGGTFGANLLAGGEVFLSPVLGYTYYKTTSTSSSWKGTAQMKTLSGDVVNRWTDNNKATYYTDHYLAQVNDVVIGSATILCPIILDVTGIGKPDVSHDNHLPHFPAFYQDKVTFFDWMGVGQRELTEWVGPNSGILVIPDKNGNVTSALQFFGSPGGWQNGYEKLEALYDKRHTGVVTADELQGVAVWINKAGDGIVHPGEIVSLESLGITAISAVHKNYESWYQLKDGTKRKTWDWWPTVQILKQVGKDTLQPK